MFSQSIFKRSAGLFAKAPSSYTTENSAPPSTTAALPTATPSTTFGCLSFAGAQFTPSVESATSASFRVLLRGAQVPALVDGAVARRRAPGGGLAPANEARGVSEGAKQVVGANVRREAGARGQAVAVEKQHRGRGGVGADGGDNGAQEETDQPAHQILLAGATSSGSVLTRRRQTSPSPSQTWGWSAWSASCRLEPPPPRQARRAWDG